MLIPAKRELNQSDICRAKTEFKNRFIFKLIDCSVALILMNNSEPRFSKLSLEILLRDLLLSFIDNNCKERNIFLCINPSKDEHYEELYGYTLAEGLHQDIGVFIKVT